MNGNYRIETADTKEKYEGLRTLWCEVFNDEPSFIDGMYSFFGANPKEGIYTSDNIKGYLCLSDEGFAVSALTCFRCGDLDGTASYTSYAICTDPECRGLGFAGSLVEHVRDIVLESGGVSVISPAEPSLENFYSAHGYEAFFMAESDKVKADDEEAFIFDEEDGEYDKVNPAFKMKKLSASEYNDYRESFLGDRPHIFLNEYMINLVYDESRRPDGSSGLMLINDGDAICALGETGEDEIEISELLVNPALLDFSPEIASEIALRVAAHFGKKAAIYTAPGRDKCQSMIAGRNNLTDENITEAYYGFPIN